MEIANFNQKDSLELSQLDSFEKTYQKLHQAVYTNIFKIVQDHTCAEDLLQDVFVSLWEHIHELETDRIPNWLFVVSFNKSITFLKKNKRIQFDRGAKHLDALEDIEEINEHEFAEKMLLIYEAIDLLPEKKRQVFKKYRMEGKPIEEIACEMQLSIHTVKDHLKIANRLIRDHITQNITLKTGLAVAVSLLISPYF